MSRSKRRVRWYKETKAKRQEAKIYQLGAMYNATFMSKELRSAFNYRAATTGRKLNV